MLGSGVFQFCEQYAKFFELFANILRTLVDVLVLPAPKFSVLSNWRARIFFLLWCANHKIWWWKFENEPENRRDEKGDQKKGAKQFFSKTVTRYVGYAGKPLANQNWRMFLGCIYGGCNYMLSLPNMFFFKFFLCQKIYIRPAQHNKKICPATCRK